MKKFNNTIIIGIDHGYGNMKTASCCFPTGLIAYDSEPLFTKELLVYNGRYYLIGNNDRPYPVTTVNDNHPDNMTDSQLYEVTVNYTSAGKIPYIQ